MDLPAPIEFTDALRLVINPIAPAAVLASVRHCPFSADAGKKPCVCPRCFLPHIRMAFWSYGLATQLLLHTIVGRIAKSSDCTLDSLNIDAELELIRFRKTNTKQFSVRTTFRTEQNPRMIPEVLSLAMRACMCWHCWMRWSSTWMRWWGPWRPSCRLRKRWMELVALDGWWLWRMLASMAGQDV
ncbi:hypothetical protein AMAG_19108 [Allomyces macrogynus ATCC 38327]|uniref:Uncharacterized protein n=1 Tax=Allomyces macrogynus (strain ATCC 38327) TaxID=578462 RepID=A0A0L0SNM9_ALLM3|nr:hypothetical protein AMAG_19108 [Allomyces macrogynus ATCC 38327]|eukprot:KNE64131.1 hypothetical protein AMAG_19108 [Allomyces macrogynus ATCC 38327]